MKIGIIGAGKVGSAFAIGLQAHGHEIHVCSRSDESAQELVARLGMKGTNTLMHVVENSEVIFITVPDTRIRRVAGEILEKAGTGAVAGKTFLHCSGATTSEALAPLEEAGGFTGSLHPLQTFADRENGWKGLYGSYFGYEGSDGALPAVQAVKECFNGSLLWMKQDDKALYHAAACILSNYTVTLSYIAGMLFEKIQLPPEEAVAALQPLLEKTVQNVGNMGSPGALTGPIARGDAETLEKHMAAIGEKAPELAEVYRTLGQWTVQLAMKKGSIDKDVGEKLTSLLKVEI
jgi:predicted short-subunit dehydrogenase-like oxidoreductase (DUF2520 family)